MSDDFEKEFSRQKRRSFLQVLFKAARLANDAALARARARTGHDWIRPAHTNLFPHIPFDGIRLTDLADRLGISKQATQVLIDDLTDGDLLERVPDPADGRAKLIRWTDDGRDSLVSGVALLSEFETELAATLGEQQITSAHQTLLALVDHLESGTSDD